MVLDGHVQAIYGIDFSPNGYALYLNILRVSLTPVSGTKSPPVQATTQYEYGTCDPLKPYILYLHTPQTSLTSGSSVTTRCTPPNPTFQNQKMLRWKTRQQEQIRHQLPLLPRQQQRNGIFVQVYILPVQDTTAL